MQTTNSVRGTLSKHRDKWRIIISYYDNTGKRKQKTFSTGLTVKGNKRRAEQMLAEKVTDFEKSLTGYQTADGTTTVSEYVQIYLNSRKDTVRDTTLYTYSVNYNTHIKDYFNNIKLRDATPKVIDAYYTMLATKISNTTITNVCTVLNGAFDMAVRQEIISVNPCSLIRRDAVKTVYHPQSKKCLNDAELETALKKLKNEKIYPIIALAVFYGLRRGELLGLTWDNVDMDNKVFYIRRTMAKVGARNYVIRDYCKNKSSERACTMSDDIYNLFLDIKQKQDICKQVTGNKFAENDYDFVFTKSNGTPYTTTGLSGTYTYVLKKHNLTRNRLHDLRHTAATLMFEHGADAVTVQHALGHSTVNTTLNVYVHNTDTTNSKASEIMSNVVHL